MLSLEEAIVEKLQKGGPCFLDDVVAYLPNFIWGEIFLTVHRMSRDGRVSLRHGVLKLSDHTLKGVDQGAH